MFNDRDLTILGGGGLLAIFCLLPNWPYWLKIALALLIMVGALVLALLRVGADRRTLEQQLFYYFRYRASPKRYQYYGRKGSVPPGPVQNPKSGPQGSPGPIRLAWA